MNIVELKDIKGIGVKRLQKLNSAGIFTPIDLISHFPYKYIDTTKTPNFNEVEDGEEVSFLGVVKKQPQVRFIRKGLNMVKCEFIVNDRTITCTWFNFRFILKQLIEGKEYYIVGKVKKFKNSIDISTPTLYKNHEGLPNVIPLYKSVVPSNILIEAIAEVLNSIKISSYVPREIANKFNLIELMTAFRNVHKPNSLESANLAMRSIATENLSYTISVYSLLKKKNELRENVYIDKRTELNNFMKSLPYELTLDQIKALNDILDSFHENKQMNRLLQGDVGCGKTIVVYLSMYYAYLNGYQSVFMAPTEILAKQHYMNALKLFEMYNVRIEYLSGNQTKLQRDTALFNIKHGNADIVIGTHALIQDDVEFSKLSYIVTDEQHRFGVNQRAKLENKADNTDCLVLSATPIPRTIALTLYGDLSFSTIKTMPKSKAKIKTQYVPKHKINDMYKYLNQKASEGQQSYIVCPRIVDEENTELISAVKLYEELNKGIFKGIVGLLHGQMKDNEKNLIMQDFKSGMIKILISTTIIEVGIDIPNATSIVIFNMERYGLSQLHQMRGRVGRGTSDSFCFLLSDSDNINFKQRLDTMLTTSDGFALAELDFEMRGAGDFIGTRQHGDAFSSNVKITVDIIKQAKDISSYLLEDNDIMNSMVSSLQDKNTEFIKSITLN